MQILFFHLYKKNKNIWRAFVKWQTGYPISAAFSRNQAAHSAHIFIAIFFSLFTHKTEIEKNKLKSIFFSLFSPSPNF